MSSTEGSLIEFMQTKWRQWFKALDINKDDMLSKDDYIECVNEFENYYSSRVNETRLADMKEGFRLFWEEFILRNCVQKDSISADEFVASLTEEFQTNRAALRDLARRMVTAICKSLDADENGFLSYKECEVTFHAFGVKDEAAMEKLYKDYQPSEKGIELTKFTETWIDLAVGEDQKKENVPSKSYLSGL